MALIKLGAMVSELSGSIGGSTFARNRTGAYVRNRSIPVQPNTTRQQQVKSIMQQVVHHWQELLSDSERDQWKTYAAQISWNNVFGDEAKLTGYNHFVRTNTARLLCGLEIVEAGPAVFTLPEADSTLSVAASAATQELTVTFDDTAAWCDEDGAALAIYTGQPISPTRNFYAGPWRFADSIDGDSVTAPSSGATVACPFTFQADQKLVIRARLLMADGRMSRPFRTELAAGA